MYEATCHNLMLLLNVMSHRVIICYVKPILPISRCCSRWL